MKIFHHHIYKNIFFPGKDHVSKQAGFTLIELLVVLMIISTLSVIFIPRLSSFRNRQTLQDSVLNLQSVIRTAQQNAVSGVKCGDDLDPTIRAKNWHVELKLSANTYTLHPRCSTNDKVPEKVYQLPSGISYKGIYVDDGTPIPPSRTLACTGTVFVGFDNILGTFHYSDPDLGLEHTVCTGASGQARLIIVLQSTETGDEATLLVGTNGVIQ